MVSSDLIHSSNCSQSASDAEEVSDVFLKNGQVNFRMAASNLSPSERRVSVPLSSSVWLSKAEESYIGKIGFLPKEEKKRIHSTFSALLSRTDSARNIIHGLLFNRHGYNVLQDKEGNFYFDIEEIRKQLAESNKRYFTDKDKEYFDKLQDVYIAFKNLQAFEGKEKYTAFSNTETFNLWMRHGFNAESLIRSWEWGKMSDGYLKMMEE